MGQPGIHGPCGLTRLSKYGALIFHRIRTHVLVWRRRSRCRRLRSTNCQKSCKSRPGRIRLAAYPRNFRRFRNSLRYPRTPTKKFLPAHHPNPNRASNPNPKSPTADMECLRPDFNPVPRQSSNYLTVLSNQAHKQTYD